MKKVKLGEVCDILDNKRIPITAAKRISGPYPYYGANGVQDYVADYIFDDELVLLAEDGGYFGSKDKPIAYRVSGKCWVNNHAHVLKPKNNINVDYLCYSLMFYDVSNLVNGATRQKLTQADMLCIEIPICSIEKQKNIVQLLDKVCDLIALRKQQLAKLDELIKARFVEMFGEPDEKNIKWKKVRLGDYIEIIGGYAFKSDSFTNNGIPILRIGNVNTGQFNKKNLVFWYDTPSLSRYAVYPGDIVISLTGTVGKDDYGNVCIIDKSFSKYYLNQRNAKLLIKNSFSSLFIAMLMSFPFIKKKLTSVNRGIRQANIANKDIADLIIPAPPLELQNEFASFVEKIDKSKVDIKKSLEELNLLKKSLMQEYFR